MSKNDRIHKRIKTVVLYELTYKVPLKFSCLTLLLNYSKFINQILINGPNRYWHKYLFRSSLLKIFFSALIVFRKNIHCRKKVQLNFTVLYPIFRISKISIFKIHTIDCIQILDFWQIRIINYYIINVIN